jgi:ribose transport system substrate-binding protein
MLALLIAALSLPTLIGCGGEDEGDTVRIGLIAKSTNNPVFLAAREGAEARAAELSEEHGIDVEILWQTPPSEDAQEQANRLNQLTAQGVDGIIISCSDASAVTNAINTAVESDIPVMCFDSDAPNSKRFAYYGVDDIATGEMVMEWLAMVMGEEGGQVAILAGNQNAPNLQARAEGVRRKAAELGDIEIIGTFYHEETPGEATNAVQRAMGAHPEIDGWAMIGGWPLFSDALLNDWDPAVKIVAVDALPAQLPYVEEGVAQALLAQLCYHWGYISTEMTFRKAYLGEDVETQIMELQPVTELNLGWWAQKLDEWGFEVDQRFLEMDAEQQEPLPAEQS